MIKQFVVTLKMTVQPSDEQRFIDWVRGMPEIESVMPIVEMGRPMTPEVLTIHKLNAAALVDGGDAVVRKWGLQMQEILKEVDRARLAELALHKSLKAGNESQRNYEQKISVLEQRLAQYGDGDRR